MTHGDIRNRIMYVLMSSYAIVLRITFLYEILANLHLRFRNCKREFRRNLYICTKLLQVRRFTNW